MYFRLILLSDFRFTVLLSVQIEDLRKKKSAAEGEYRNSMPASSYQQQKLRVCEVCSAYLGIHDNDRRLADHFGGKLHLGFIKIREKLADLEVSIVSGWSDTCFKFADIVILFKFLHRCKVCCSDVVAEDSSLL